MQQTAYCEACNLYSADQGYLCGNCGGQATIMLNPDNNGGFRIDTINEGYIYFHDTSDFKLKERIIQKLLKLALDRKTNVSYIN